MPRKNANVQALIDENAELKNTIAEQKSFINSAFQQMKDTERHPTMVPVKNYSGSNFVYNYTYRGQDKRLSLESTGPRQVGSLPLEVWAEIEREEKYKENGFIVRTDVPNDNPNCIDDIPKFVNNSTEKEIKTRIEKITVRGVLTLITQYLDTIPDKEKTAKQLTAYNAIKSAMFEKFKIQLIDEE
jgi:hypothetical protein